MSITGLGASETRGFFRHQPGRPLRNSEGPSRNQRFSCTRFHNRTTSLYNLVIIKLLVYGDCPGLSLFNDNHPPSKHQPSIFHLQSSKLPIGRLPVGSLSPGGGTGSKTPWSGTQQFFKYSFLTFSDFGTALSCLTLVCLPAVRHELNVRTYDSGNCEHRAL